MGGVKVAWSPEMLEWLRENYKKYTYAESAAILNEKFGVNLTRSSVVTRAYTLGLRRQDKRYRHRPPLTAEMIEFLKKNYKRSSYRQTAVKLNEKFGTDYPTVTIQKALNRHGLKSELKRGSDAWSEEKCKAVREKKLRIAENGGNKHIRPIGYEHTWNNRVFIKVGNNKYRLKMRVMWEKYNGRPLDIKEVIVPLDGNLRNMAPENLVLLTRCELMKLVRQYGRDSVGEELKAKILLVKLDLKAKELMKK